MTKFDIVNIIGKNSAILHSDGLLVFEKIKDTKEPLIISFLGIEQCTTAFLNASIGKFLAENPTKSDFLTFEGIKENDYLASKVKLVVENVESEKKRNSLNSSAHGYLFAQ